MKRILLVLFGIALAIGSQNEANAQTRKTKSRNKANAQARNNTGLPKVDFRIGPIRPVGQGLGISVTNRGFAMSPKSSVSVAVYDAKSRQLLMTKVLTLPATRPNQTRRVIFVPPAGKLIMVRAKVDPQNRVAESNERNNEIASRHQM